jgi:hypothetical protein
MTSKPVEFHVKETTPSNVKGLENVKDDHHDEDFIIILCVKTFLVKQYKRFL